MALLMQHSTIIVRFCSLRSVYVQIEVWRLRPFAADNYYEAKRICKWFDFVFDCFIKCGHCARPLFSLFIRASCCLTARALFSLLFFFIFGNCLIYVRLSIYVRARKKI